MIIYFDIRGGRTGYTFSLDEKTKHFILMPDLYKMLKEYIKDKNE